MLWGGGGVRRETPNEAIVTPPTRQLQKYGKPAEVMKFSLIAVIHECSRASLEPEFIA